MEVEIDNLPPRIKRLLKTRTPDEVAKKLLNEMLKETKAYQLARDLDINRGLINYVLDGNHSPTVLEALGLPVLEKKDVEICIHCGKVHTQHKTCTDQRQQRKRHRVIANLENEEQVEALKDWVKVYGFKTWTEYCRQMATNIIEGDLIRLNKEQ